MTYEERKQKVAEAMIGGIASSANVVDAYSGTKDADGVDFIRALRKNADNVEDGDLSGLETMLASQAVALDLMFMNLSMRASQNMGHHMDATEKYLKLAMKAQSQCRCTIEALSEIKNPKPFIQHNKAINQQVNNGSADSKRTSTRRHAQAENKNNKNKLFTEPMQIEEQHAPNMDTTAAKRTIREDQTMETVAK